MKKKTSTITIAFWYMVCSFLTAGLGFLTTPIFTRIISTEEYGEFVNFSSWETIIFAITSLQLFASIPRAKYDYDKDMNEYMSTIVSYTTIVNILLYIVVESFSDVFELMLAMDIKYIRILFLYLTFFPAFNVLQSKLRIYNEYKLFVLLSILTSVFQVSTSIVAVFFMKDKLLGRTLGYVVPMLIVSICIWLLIEVRGRFKVNKDMLKYALLISVPLIPHALAGNLLGSSDRIMIKNICGAESAAVYSVSYTVTSVISLVWLAFNGAWTPWLYDKLHEGKHKVIKEKTNLYIFVFTCFFAIIIMVLPEVLSIMGGEKYKNSLNIMPVVAVGFLFQFMYSLFVNIEFYEKKTVYISVGTFLSAGMNVILNMIFIPKYGYVAAAYTTLVGFIALFVFHWSIVWRTKEYRTLYDYKHIVVGCVITTALSVACSCLYRFSFIYRYLLLVILSIVVGRWIYINRNVLLDIINHREE